jgi:hypothetical protein
MSPSRASKLKVSVVRVISVPDHAFVKDLHCAQRRQIIPRDHFLAPTIVISRTFFGSSQEA